MKLTFKKEYSGDESTLPQRTVPGAVQFREPSDIKKLSAIANAIALVVTLLLLIPVWKLQGGLRGFFGNVIEAGSFLPLLGFLAASLLVLPAHEFLHAVCFRGDVEFYTALKKGLLFVIGTEDMTVARFVFMSLLPNLVFGFLPYLAFLLGLRSFWLGLFSAICIGAGGGDYINIFNALTQVPRGGLVFMSGMHSYWYRPQNGADNA